MPTDDEHELRWVHFLHRQRDGSWIQRRGFLYCVCTTVRLHKMRTVLMCRDQGADKGMLLLWQQLHPTAGVHDEPTTGRRFRQVFKCLVARGGGGQNAASVAAANMS